MPQLTQKKPNQHQCKQNNCTLVEVKYNYTKNDFKKIVQEIKIAIKSKS